MLCGLALLTATTLLALKPPNVDCQQLAGAFNATNVAIDSRVHNLVVSNGKPPAVLVNKQNDPSNSFDKEFAQQSELNQILAPKQSDLPSSFDREFAGQLEWNKKLAPIAATNGNGAPKTAESEFGKSPAWNRPAFSEFGEGARDANQPVRRAEVAAGACFRKTKPTLATPEEPSTVRLKPSDANKKHPSNEYQVYGSSEEPAANPSASTGPHSPGMVESTTLAGDKKVVGEIIDQLKDINSIGKGDDAPTPLTCSRDGSWYSEAGGIRLDLITADKILHVEVIESVPKRDGVLACEGWNVTGEVPFPENNAPFLLLGLNDVEKMVAAFIGQCAICSGHEKVVGKWLVVEEARDCASMVTATAEVPDVFHRELLHILKANKLERLNLTDCFPSTPHHTTTTKLPPVKKNKGKEKKERRRRHQRIARTAKGRWKRDGGRNGREVYVGAGRRRRRG